MSDTLIRGETSSSQLHLINRTYTVQQKTQTVSYSLLCKLYTHTFMSNTLKQKSESPWIYIDIYFRKIAFGYERELKETFHVFQSGQHFCNMWLKCMTIMTTPAGLSSARSTCPICQDVDINAATSPRLHHSHLLPWTSCHRCLTMTRFTAAHKAVRRG